MQKNPTRRGGTYLFSLYKGVPPPPPQEITLLFFLRETSEVRFKHFQSRKFAEGIDEFSALQNSFENNSLLRFPRHVIHFDVELTKKKRNKNVAPKN